MEKCSSWPSDALCLHAAVKQTVVFVGLVRLVGVVGAEEAVEVVGLVSVTFD